MVNKTILKLESFLENNGFKCIEIDEYDKTVTYQKNKDLFIVELAIDGSEIVFIDDTGDFLHVDCNYYTLIGALMEFKALPCNYKSVTHD